MSEYKFSNGKWAISVKTVGELVEELQKLPKGMPVNQGFDSGADVVVFNRKTEPFVELCECEEWVDRAEP